ncbi:MAG: germination protein YpeB [Christensenellaceae bacterium]|jgi:germination protein YpeB|nr:germination protein YpeB [Christensenellaceae bacterium]
MNKGLLIGLIIAILIAIGLGVTLGIVVTHEKIHRTRLDGLYAKAHYEASDAISNIEVKLSKLSVVNSSNMLKKLLHEICRDSSIASINLSQLAVESEEITVIIKFLNQTGDYAKYLAEHDCDDILSTDAIILIEKIRGTIKIIQNALSETSSLILTGKNFVSGIKGRLSIMDACFNRLDTDEHLEYPEMIYDGPFSDGLDNREAKYLINLNDIDIDAATKIIRDKFINVQDLRFLCERFGPIPGYVFDVTWHGGNGCVIISKRGGMIVEYSSFADTRDSNVPEEQCVTLAEELLGNFGYHNLQPVWVSGNQSIVYINFAYVLDDIIYYPDIIKVKMSSDTAQLLGLEASNYIYNHTYDREITSDIKTSDMARGKLNSSLIVQTQRLCVIPVDYGREVLTFEFSVTLNGEMYYIYLDASTLSEIKVMKVIESDAGRLIV